MPCGFLEEFAYLLLLDVVVVVVTADLLSYHSVLLSPARVISKSVGDALHDEKGQTSRRVKNRPPRNSRQITGTRFRSCMTSSSSSSSTASLDIHTHTYINMLFLFRVVCSSFLFGSRFLGYPPGERKGAFSDPRFSDTFRLRLGVFFGAFLVFFFFFFFFFFLCMFASSQHLRRQKIRRVIN